MQASEDFWDDILGHLRDRVLLPVVGPELVTVRDGERKVTLSRLLGERVAVRYQLEVSWGRCRGWRTQWARFSRRAGAGRRSACTAW